MVVGLGASLEVEDFGHFGLFQAHQGSYQGQVQPAGIQKVRLSRPRAVGAAAAVDAGGASKVVMREAVWSPSPLFKGPFATEGAAVMAGKFGAWGAGEAFATAKSAAAARANLEKAIGYYVQKTMRDKK